MSNFENRNTDMPPKWRSFLHIGMGIMYLLFGAAVYYVKSFGSIDLSMPAVYGLSGLLAIYGLFRIWRGVTDIRRQSNQ